MVLVDSCVWSAALRRKKTPEINEEAVILKRLIQQHRAVMIGPVLQEVLTGVRYEEQFMRLQKNLKRLNCLELLLWTTFKPPVIQINVEGREYKVQIPTI